MADELYVKDFYAWSQDQAAALLDRGRDNHLDRERLAEEVAGLGRSHLSAVQSYVTRILEHMLKLEHIPLERDQAHWRREIRAFRINLRRRLTPSTMRATRMELDTLFEDARDALRLYPEFASADVPFANPYTWEDVLGRGEDWVPEPRAPG